jgi:hypothetical protein
MYYPNFVVANDNIDIRAVGTAVLTVSAQAKIVEPVVITSSTNKIWLY